MKRFIIGEVLQWITACMMLGGIVAEYILKADAFYVLITAGGVFWGISQKIKHPANKETKNANKSDD